MIINKRLTSDIEELDDNLVANHRSIEVIEEVNEPHTPTNNERLNSYPVNAENGCVTLSEQHFVELQKTIKELKLQLKQREAAYFCAKEVWIFL